MDIIAAIKSRRSVRKFKQDPVPRELIKNIIEIATWAPSATNKQGWRFIIIDDQKTKDQIVDHGGTMPIKNAPAGILVLYDSRTTNLEYQDHIQSGAAVTQNLLLVASDFGLGACWLCMLPPKKTLQKLLNIPVHFMPIAYVMLGYKLKEGQAEVPRKYDADKLIGYNLFNTDFSDNQVNMTKVMARRFLTKIYYLMPIAIKRKFANNLIDNNFVKKFQN